MLQSRNRLSRITRAAVSLVAFVVLAFVLSCSSSESKAKKVLEAYLKNLGAREVKMETFYTSKEFPDKAYASVLVTYNFADSSGKYQTEHSGYILRREGDSWAIVKSTNYTTDQQKANDYLAGRK